MDVRLQCESHDWIPMTNTFDDNNVDEVDYCSRCVEVPKAHLEWNTNVVKLVVDVSCKVDSRLDVAKKSVFKSSKKVSRLPSRFINPS